MTTAGEREDRINFLRAKRIAIRNKFMHALNNGHDQECGRLDEEDRQAYAELTHLLAERARQP